MIEIAHRADMRSRLVIGVAAIVSLGVVMALLGAAMVSRTHALEGGTVVVTPNNLSGWTSSAPLADTRANGTASFVADANAPLGTGALSLVTGDSTVGTDGSLQDKVQFMHAADPNMLVRNVTDLSYYTKQVSASFAGGLPSFQLPVCLEGVTEAGACAPVPGTGQSSFTTLVYEPYVNYGTNAVVQGQWQFWNVGQGKFWSSRTVGILTGSQGSSVYPLSVIKSHYPNAVVLAFGVDVGSNNPNYNTRVDAVTVNDTTYDFELGAPTDKDQCKNNGWKTLTDLTGTPFTNQGQCVSFVVSNRP